MENKEEGPKATTITKRSKKILMNDVENNVDYLRSKHTQRVHRHFVFNSKMNLDLIWF